MSGSGPVLLHFRLVAKLAKAGWEKVVPRTPLKSTPSSTGSKSSSGWCRRESEFASERESEAELDLPCRSRPEHPSCSRRGNVIQSVLSLRSRLWRARRVEGAKRRRGDAWYRRGGATKPSARPVATRRADGGCGRSLRWLSSKMAKHRLSPPALISPHKPHLQTSP